MARPANDARMGAPGQGGEWYNPPYPRSVAEAANWPMFRERAAWLATQYPSASAYGIAGCGTGLTLYWLYTDHGKQPYGCDVQWSTSIAAGVVPGGTSRIRTADVLSSGDMEQFRRMAMGGNQRNKYPVLLTEDLLPAMSSDAEVATALANLRAIATTLVHIITPSPDAPGATTDMLWHTFPEWRALIGSGERILSPALVEVP